MTELRHSFMSTEMSVLETAGRVVAKYDQTLVWVKKFYP